VHEGGRLFTAGTWAAVLRHTAQSHVSAPTQA